METHEISTFLYFNKEIELLVERNEKEIIPEYIVRGRQEALREIPMTKAHLNTVCENPIQSQQQNLIYKIFQILPVGASVLKTKDINELADKNINTIDPKIYDYETRIALLEVRNKVIKPERLKTQFRKWYNPAAKIFALGDGLIAFGGLLKIYNVLLSLILALAIAFAILLLPIPFAHWSMRAKSLLQKTLRLTSVIIVSALGFYFLAMFRADAFNSVVPSGFNPTGNIVITPIVIWGVSIFLFYSLFIFNLFLYSNPAQRALEDEFFENLREIQLLTKKCSKLKVDESMLQVQKITERDKSRLIHNYRKTSINRLKAAGQRAYDAFKEAYATRRGTPDCFAIPFEFTYDETDPLQN